MPCLVRGAPGVHCRTRPAPPALLSVSLRTLPGTTARRYVAHQLALLYRGLSPFKFGKPFRKRIEGLFDQVRASADASAASAARGPPRMPLALCLSLQRVIGDLLAETRSVPAELRQKWEPAVALAATKEAE